MRLWFIILSLMKIVSWNVNSVRARIENIINYIDKNKPDLLLLQEIKLLKKIFLLQNLGKRVMNVMLMVKKAIMELLYYQRIKLIILKKILLMMKKNNLE